MENTIKDVYIKSREYLNQYGTLLYEFLMKAYELVGLSKDLYQVEKTLILNKISLKDYVLNSEVCLYLKANNISNYSIEDLKRYIDDYEKQNMKDLHPYKVALDLYEMLEQIEKLEVEQIDYEFNNLCTIFDDLKGFKSEVKDKCDEIYSKVVNEVNFHNYSDDTKSLIMTMLGEIFNYYKYGNKMVPLESSSV